MGALRRAVPPGEARRAGAEVARRLLALPELAGAARVALYAARPDELPTADLLEALRARGRATCFPRVGPDGGLEFAAADRFEDLAFGRYGVAEPKGPATELGPGDAVVVPGLAFDGAGRRLGRGGGYYDRTFPAGRPGPFLVGVGYAFQRVDEVPAEAHDRRMDAVVTDAESLRAPARADGPEGGARR
jgi:5-formyltetrahydrofolate cyclo-ligase